MADNSAEESRTELVAALTGAGLEVTWEPGDRASGPGALVEPADPWIERYAIGESVKQINWRIVIFANRDQKTSAIHDLTQGALIAIRVIDQMPGWSSTNVSGFRSVPGSTEPGQTGSPFTAVELTTSTHIQVIE